MPIPSVPYDKNRILLLPLSCTEISNGQMLLFQKPKKRPFAHTYFLTYTATLYTINRNNGIQNISNKVNFLIPCHCKTSCMLLTSSFRPDTLYRFSPSRAIAASHLSHSFWQRRIASQPYIYTEIGYCCRSCSAGNFLTRILL